MNGVSLGIKCTACHWFIYMIQVKIQVQYKCWYHHMSLLHWLVNGLHTQSTASHSYNHTHTNGRAGIQLAWPTGSTWGSVPWPWLVDDHSSVTAALLEWPMANYLSHSEVFSHATAVKCPVSQSVRTEEADERHWKVTCCQLTTVIKDIFLLTSGSM